MDNTIVLLLKNVRRQNMKKWLLVAVVIIAVAFSGCGGGATLTKDAKSIFETWLEAAKALESMREDNSSVIEMCTKGSSQCTRVDIEGQLYVKDNKQLDELELTVGTTKQKIRQYLFEDEVYVATMVEGEWVANKVDLSIYFNSDEGEAKMESLYKRGALVVGTAVETKSIAGEECACVMLSAQLSKLSLEDKKFLLFSGGFSAMPDVDPYVDALKSYNAKLCVLPNGMVLESETNLEFDADALPPDGIVSSHILSTVLDYEIAPVIPVLLFDLPAPPTPAPQSLQIVDEATFRMYFKDFSLARLPPGIDPSSDEEWPMHLQKTNIFTQDDKTIVTMGEVLKEVQLKAGYYDVQTGSFVGGDPTSTGPGMTLSPGGFAGAEPLTLPKGNYELRLYVGETLVAILSFDVK
jgi:hypothetical protein